MSTKSKAALSPVQDVPEDFVCPITFQVMKDPVMDHEGNSYERKAITEWVQRHQQSPVTRSHLSTKQLVPNRALKSMIEKWLQARVAGASENLSQLKVEPSHSKSRTAHSVVGGTVTQPCKVAITATPKGSAVVSVIPTVKAGRVPVDVCCVIDVSGSMGVTATLKDASGKNEGHGLSVLDVAKHSVRTIAETLTAADRLSIVSYSTTSRVVMSLQKMDARGKRKAQAAVLALSASGQTNLWAGLVNGLEDLAKNNSTGRLQTVMLLTDGLPNISPPRGEAAMLKRRREKADKKAEKDIVINTFGFGYNLDTSLLRQLSQTGMGSFAFIPDASMVGTIFVNALANTLVTVGTHLELTIKCINGAKLANQPANAQLRLCPSNVSADLKQACISLGTIQLGQTRDVFVSLNLPEDADSSKQYLVATLAYSYQLPKTSKVVESVYQQVAASDEINYCQCRLALIDGIFGAVEAMPDRTRANKIIFETIDFIKTKNTSGKPKIKSLLQDLYGQVKEAISRDDWFQKWGKHYLPSLALAHLQQQCNNFKDPGVQHYGGEDFATQRDLADEIFCKMPPPIRAPLPAASVNGRSANRPSNARARPQVSMTTYMNRGGGCFHGSCRVLMADGTFKQIRNIEPGDVIAYSSNGARVRCVVKYTKSEGVAELVNLPDSKLLATPWHPVRANKKAKWAFPADVSDVKQQACDAVYNLLLEKGHIARIEGWECITLAHGMKGDVVGHKYFGTQSIVDDLKRMPGWDNGKVTYETDKLVIQRDKTTGHVVGITSQSLS